MAVKRAKTLTKEQLDMLLDYITHNSSMPVRDRLLLLLSHKAGLRAGEIAKMDMKAVTDSEGRIAKYITVFANVGKKKNERVIPMHPAIRDALKEFRFNYPNEKHFAIGRYKRDKPMTPAVLTTWFWKLYAAAGFTGCSSHSGRRTFGTNMARSANNFHNSLRDVQRLLGHSRLETTEAYIEPSDDVSNMVFAV
ncbi:site-specific integrase [Sphingobium sp. MK2]|uniref:tyrosine-type recombinase/integrase n=1 Tax=Sphingobium sp. MK2 TaxID=3116540 RepID=UPI0032E35DCB